MIFNNKGFLFTISIVIFASTLVFLAQEFNDNSVNASWIGTQKQKAIAPLMINDDISTDTLKILATTMDVNYYTTGNVEINLTDSQPKLNNIATTLTDYNNFVSSKNTRVAGFTKSINFEGITDGSAEITALGSIQQKIQYDSNYSILSPLNSEALTAIDINITAPTYSLKTYSWSINSGSIPLTLTYTDDTNFFSISTNISGTAASTLTITHTISGVDYTSTIIFGLANSINNSIKITSNNAVIKYSLKAKYDSITPSWPSVTINSRLLAVALDANYNALLKVQN
jgi:hypothetical protein